MSGPEISGYRYTSGDANCAHECLMPSVLKELDRVRKNVHTKSERPRLFDLGCGNGSAGAVWHRDGWDVYGVDVSDEGIHQAQKNHPSLHLSKGSAYDDLASKFGTFPVVVSLEVVEHVYAPRSFARTVFDLLEPGGTAIISTPYHGYLKNLAIAVAGRMDTHLSPLWDHGHIKFWSRRSLTRLLEETNFRNIRLLRVGRVPPLARSMIAVAQKPKVSEA